MRTVPAAILLSLTLVGGNGVAAAQDGGSNPGGPPYTPKSPAAARALAEERIAYDLINRASRFVSAARADCRAAPLPTKATTTTDPPSQAILDALAVLRRPATPEEAQLPRAAMFAGLGEVHLNHVRFVTAANGEEMTILVARRAQASYRISDFCLDAQRARLATLLEGKSPRIRSVTLQAFGKVREGQERDDEQPARPRDGIYLFTSGGSGGGGGAVEQLTRRGSFFSSGTRDASRLYGVVPDGVASVTLDYPRTVSRGRYYKPTVYPRAARLTARVQQNVLSERVPRGAGDAFPPRMVWRAADGSVVRVVRQPR